MRKDPFPYESLHEYLEKVLSVMECPTDTQIKQAKKDYWRLYHRFYRRQRRKVFKEVTLALDQKTLKEIEKRRKNVPLTQFIYRLVVQSLEDQPSAPVDREVWGNITIQLASIFDLLEAPENSHTDIHPHFKELWERIIHLEQLLNECFGRS